MTARRGQVREARLRSEFADRYPGVEPDVWYTAATLAEHLSRRMGQGGDAESSTGPRVLPQEHFEFRGGEPPVGVRAVLGRRPED